MLGSICVYTWVLSSSAPVLPTWWAAGWLWPDDQMLMIWIMLMGFHKEVWYYPFGIVRGLTSCVYTWTVHSLMNSPWLLVYHVTCKHTHRLSRHSTFWSLFGYPPAFISLPYKLCQSGHLPLLLPLDSHSWSPGSILPHLRSPPSLREEARWLPVPVWPIWPMWTLAVTVPLCPFISYL